MACLCSPWNCAPNVCRVCGEFPTPVVEDLGRCSPHRVKTDCEAPVLPVIQCNDDEYRTIYQPENVDHPFAVSARLFDENCEPIWDQNGNDITLILV